MYSCANCLVCLQIQGKREKRIAKDKAERMVPEMVSHFQAVFITTQTRDSPAPLTPLHVCCAIFQSGITATFLFFNSHFPFFLRNYTKHADSIHCIVRNQLFPLYLPEIFLVISCGLPHCFPTIGTEKLYFPERNKCILSTSSNKYHILLPD